MGKAMKDVKLQLPSKLGPVMMLWEMRAVDLNWDNFCVD
jgi:hypothetical protein